jgi:hypothetical protein
MFTSIFGYGPGSGTLELRIRIRQKFRILADPDPQHWSEYRYWTIYQLFSKTFPQKLFEVKYSIIKNDLVATGTTKIV